MDNLLIALLVSIFSGAISAICMIMVKPYLKDKTNKKFAFIHMQYCLCCWLDNLL